MSFTLPSLPDDIPEDVKNILALLFEALRNPPPSPIVKPQWSAPGVFGPDDGRWVFIQKGSKIGIE